MNLPKDSISSNLVAVGTFKHLMALHLGFNPTAKTDPTQLCGWATCVKSGCQPRGSVMCTECTRKVQWKPAPQQLLEMLRAAAMSHQRPLLL